MDVVDRNWMILGAIAIASVSSLLMAVGVMNPFVPMPWYLVVLGWIIAYGVFLVMPVIYLVEFNYLRKCRYFGEVVLVASLVFSILSIFYFTGSWEYGVKYHGELHTKIVAIENLVGFLCLVLIAYLGVKKESRRLKYSANLFLFLLLTWCAFPYLGELP